MSEMEQQRQKVAETSQPNRPFSVSLSTSKGPPKKTSFNLHSTSSSSRSQQRRDVRDVHGYGDDGSDLEGEEERPTHEAVTGFDARAGGAIPADELTSDANGGKHELVIKVESKNNWRDRPGINIYRPRSTKNLLPKEVQAQLLHANKEGQNSGAVDVEGPSMSYGLTFVRPHNLAVEEPTVSGEEQVTISDVPMQDVESKAGITGAVAEQRPLTQDEIALQALKRESEGQTEGRRSDLIIESSKQPMFEDNQYEVRYDEMSSFRADVATRPDSASLEDYTAIPVEEFGAALLRGMGWREGQPIGRGKYGDTLKNTQPRIPERRPGFLGIGAKDLSGGKGAEVEIGAWGKAAMRKSSGKNGDKDSGGNTDGIYMPVLMKSKKTGEFITEDEFKVRRKDKQRDGEESWRERRDRNLEKSGRDWNRDRDYRRGNGHDSEDDNDRHERSRDGSSRRDRSRSSRGRNRHSRRRDDEDSSGRDDRHYREHERDNDRDRERDRDRRRVGDGDRSPERNYRNRSRFRDEDWQDSRHSSSTPSRRDRDRDRDRRYQDRDRDRGHGHLSHRRKGDYDR